MRLVLAGRIAGFGGIQTHLYWLTRTLAFQGHEVSVISLGGEDHVTIPARFGELATTGKVKIHVPSRYSNKVTNRWKQGLEIKDFLASTKPDVYFACGTGWNLFLPAIATRSIARRVFHEVMSGEHGPGLDSRWAVRFGFHDVFAQAQPVASRFAQTFHWNKPIHVLPAFPDPLEVISDLPMAEHKIVPYGKARAAVFSRLVTHKKVLWLVRNWDRISNCISELHIFGTGPEEEPIRQAIARQQINDRVKCHGPYPSGQEYTDLLSQFDLTMLPTLGAEGAPLVLLESMACGVPFVAFNVGGIADYQNPDCSLVASDKPEFFFEAVQGFARKLSYGEVDQSRLQRWYLERFSYSVLASRWTEQLIPSRS